MSSFSVPRKLLMFNISWSCEMAISSNSILIFLLFSFLLSGYADARAFFIFGDSLVDSGNNNFLATTARADSLPYGIDYPTHRPTGRFSNGLNIPDIISEYMGARESPLPYLNPALYGLRLLVGANFASAGVGILNDTGIQFANVIRISQQLAYFQQYQARVTAMIGPRETKKLVNQALFLITLGGNDFVNNYYLVPFSFRSRQFDLSDYVQYLVSEYQKILYRLYELGARRVIVTGTGPLGCVPAELATRGRNGECSLELQRAAALYNPLLIKVLQKMNSQIGSTVFVGANTHQMNNDLISNPRAFGFVTATVACCGQGPHNGIGLCTRFSNLCANRDRFAFWDAFHPSERASRFIVQQIMTGSEQYMSPMNLSTILALDSQT